MSNMEELIAEREELIAERAARKAAAREPLPAETIVRNAIRTPDGTILTSRRRHEFVSHEDDNGETYMTDGGRDYFRRSLNEVPAEDLSVSLFHGHERVREAYDWGTYGLSGEEELHYVLLEDMTDEHIQVLIDEGYTCTPLMLAEQQWRKSAGSRKLVRQKDIERLMILKDKYVYKPEIISDLDALLEEIVEKFNSNEFNGDTT